LVKFFSDTFWTACTVGRVLNDQFAEACTCKRCFACCMAALFTCISILHLTANNTHAYI
jgi:hypothetical protein